MQNELLFQKRLQAVLDLLTAMGVVIAHHQGFLKSPALFFVGYFTARLFLCFLPSR